MGIAETRISQLKDRVVGLSVPSSAWNAKNRAAAVERLQSMGLLHRGMNIGALPIPKV